VGNQPRRRLRLGVAVTASRLTWRVHLFWF
jgi:hypothetical protein